MIFESLLTTGFQRISLWSWRLPALLWRVNRQAGPGGTLLSTVPEVYHITETLERIAIIVGMSKEKVPVGWTRRRRNVSRQR